jgi:hypothetical protein
MNTLRSARPRENAGKCGSTSCCGTLTFPTMTTTAEVHEFAGQLAELVKQVQAGNEGLLKNL